MSERRTVRGMLGESLREAATLVVVFVPLDASVRNALTIKVIVTTVVLSAVAFAGGVMLERMRK